MYGACRPLLRSPSVTLCHRCLIKSKAKPDKVQNKYTNTINLPKTTFPLRLRGNAIVERDEQILKVCICKIQVNSCGYTLYIM